MPEIDDERKEIIEPPKDDIGYCSICDVEIYIPESPDRLCPHCRSDEVVA